MAWCENAETRDESEKKALCGLCSLCRAAALLLLAGQYPEMKPDYPIQPVDYARVKLTDEFWAPRIDTNRRVTIPYLFKMNEESGRVDNFRIAAGLKKGKHTGKRYNDSDVFKAMEAAAISLRVHPDPELERRLDELIALIGKAQEPDGYIFTTRTDQSQEPRPRRGPGALVEPPGEPRAL